MKFFSYYKVIIDRSTETKWNIEDFIDYGREMGIFANDLWEAKNFYYVPSIFKKIFSRKPKFGDNLSVYMVETNKSFN